MGQLCFYVSDEIEHEIRYKANEQNLTLSQFMTELLNRQFALSNQWPEGYFDLFDQWHGEPVTRPTERNGD